MVKSQSSNIVTSASGTPSGDTGTSFGYGRITAVWDGVMFQVETTVTKGASTGGWTDMLVAVAFSEAEAIDLYTAGESRANASLTALAPTEYGHVAVSPRTLNATHYIIAWLTQP
jgi:hypothetical protein